MTTTTITTTSLFVLFIVICSSARVHAWKLTPQEAKAISSDAFIYFYPMVANYEVMYDTKEGVEDLSAFFNRFRHQTEIPTSNVTTVDTPNDDTLYSHAWLDLRAEPVIVSVPEVPQTPLKRYYVMQIVDSYTNNVGLLGSRTTGNDAGNYLIAGPSWTGYEQSKHVLEKSVNKMYRCGSNFTYLLARTLVYNESDVPNVTNIQKGYAITPLSKFLNSTSPSPLPFPKFPPIDKQKVQGVNFFAYANFIMSYTAVYPDEKDLFAQFAVIGIIPGAEYPPKNMSQDLIVSILLGIKNGSDVINSRTSEGILSRDGWNIRIDPPPFGNHTVMADHFLIRAIATKTGIYGLDLDEAMYFISGQDYAGNRLNGLNNTYRMTFTPESMPKPCGSGFWSVTLYNNVSRFYDNPINRYSIGDRTDNLYYKNGNLTLYIQHDQPKDPRALQNWLPAPNGIFYLATRIYWPAQADVDKPYFPPGLRPFKYDKK